MATDFGSYEWPPSGGGGGGGGVTSLNGETGAITLVAGTGISITPSGQNITISATGAELVFADSIVNNSGTVTLVNDSATPGNSKYYGTNSGGTLGYFSFPTNGTVTSVSVVTANGLAGTVATATTTPAITLSTTVTGILQGNGTAISAATTGNLTDAGTDGIVVTGGTGAVLGTGTSLAQHVADTTHNGYLSSTDWNTFNGKQGAGNYITALTGDVTATGPGSVAATLATVNTNVGSFGSSTSIPSFTVNGKGLITAASGNVVIAPAGTLTGTTLASNVVSSSLTSVGTLTSGTWNASTITVPFGGTGDTSFTAYSVICGGTTSTGALQNVSGVGTSGQVLTSNGPAALPTWQPSSGGGGGSAFFQASSLVSTNSSTINSTTFTTFSNASSILSFTPTISGTYKVYTSANITAGAVYDAQIRVFNTTGSATLLEESDGGQYTGVESSVFCQSVYTLTSGTAYAFSLQGRTSGSASGSVSCAGADVNFYMFAEQVATGTAANLAIGSIDGNGASADGLSISASQLYAQSASATNPGMVNIASQTFAGSKNFTSPIGYNNTSPGAATFIDAINTTGATQRLLLTGYGTSSLVGMRTRLARGTSGSPSAVQTGDILGFYNAEGYGASQFPTTATGALTILAGETFTNTSNQTYVTINSTPTGSVTSTENFRVASTGNTIGPQSSSTAIHQTNGGMNYTTRTVAASTLTVDTTTTDYIIFTDSTSNAIAITLPAPTNGRTLIIQDKTGKAATNNITIKQHSAETINGLTQYVIAQNYNAITLFSDGTNWTAQALSASGQSFLTAGTTYTTPVNITPQTRFKFTLIGGGGAGGGNTASANQKGTGGGAGGQNIVYLTGLAANTIYTTAIGGGGSGVSASTGNNGGNTTISINAVTYSANGGTGGGIGPTANGGAGGTTSNATIAITGGSGGGSPATATSSISGPGGNTILGQGGSSVVAIGAGSIVGNAGTGFGAGGSGSAGGTATTTVNTGGAGAPGAILVEWAN